MTYPGFRLLDGSIDNLQCPHLHYIQDGATLRCQACGCPPIETCKCGTNGPHYCPRDTRNCADDDTSTTDVVAEFTDCDHFDFDENQDGDMTCRVCGFTMRGFMDDAERELNRNDGSELTKPTRRVAAVLHAFTWGQANALGDVENAMRNARDAEVLLAELKGAK